MSLPLRKDQPEEELTTADLARSKPPASEVLRTEPVLSTAPLTKSEEKVAPVVDNVAHTAPLFPNDELGICAADGMPCKSPSLTSRAELSSRRMDSSPSL